MKLNLSNITSGYGAVAALNANFDAIEAAVEKTLSRDGTTPNEMLANLDMNGNDILNANAVDVSSLTINGTPVQPATGVTAAQAFQSYSFVATAGQTSFSVAPSVPYASSIQVVVNGLSLPPADISVSGTNVVIPPVQAGDEVVIRRYTDAPFAFPTADQLVFTQTGALQSRSVQSKLRDFASVQDFGAVGDGVTDDTAAIQAALNAALLVDFGDRTKNYRINGTLTLRNYNVLQFNGARMFQVARQAPLLNASNTTGVVVRGGRFTGYTAVNVNAGSFVIGVPYTIRTPGTTNFVALGAANNDVGTTFTATGAGTGTGVASTFVNTPTSQDICVKGTSATDLTVENNEFYGFNYSPLMVDLWGTNVRFLNNKIIGPGASTLTTNFRNCSGCTILGYGIQIFGNFVQDTSQGFIVGQQSTDVVVADNVIKNTIVEHGMYVDAGTKRLTIKNNLVSNTALIGIKVQWYDSVATVPTDMTIAGNIVENTGSGGDGILLINSVQNTVATITGVTQANPGVITTTAAHGLVVGNVITISGVSGMVSGTKTLNTTFVVNTTPSSTTFTVRDYNNNVVNTTSYSAYTSGGTIIKPIYGKNITVVGNSVRNCGQDAISLRFVENAIVSGNVVDTSARFGLYNLYANNIDIVGNQVSNIQQNGIYVFAPLMESHVRCNTVLNAGAAAIDAGGASSGMLFDGDGGCIVTQNSVIGEPTQTKMRYALQIGSGDKRNYTVDNNTFIQARDAGIALWNDTPDVFALRSLANNVVTASTGSNVYTGLGTAIPGRGSVSRDFFGDAAPTTGTWVQGDRLWKRTYAAESFVGWVCVVSGTPGTWVPFGPTQTSNTWSFTNLSSSRSIDGASATLFQTANTLGTLIADLKNQGILK